MVSFLSSSIFLSFFSCGLTFQPSHLLLQQPSRGFVSPFSHHFILLFFLLSSSFVISQPPSSSGFYLLFCSSPCDAGDVASLWSRGRGVRVGAT
jgi:hypothetical protein